MLSDQAAQRSQGGNGLSKAASAVTMLKAAGLSDFMAREIVGHESTAVSRQYTHLTTDDKRATM